MLAFREHWEEVPLLKSGPDACPYIEKFDPDFPQRLMEFRQQYQILEDVEIELHFGDRIHYGDDYITVPLMAITEGVLRSPFTRLVRQLLYYYDLTPHQVMVNVYLVLCSVIKLAEMHNIPMMVYDVLSIYLKAHNPKY